MFSLRKKDILDIRQNRWVFHLLHLILNQTTQHWHTGSALSVHYQRSQGVECTNLLWPDLALEDESNLISFLHAARRDRGSSARPTSIGAWPPYTRTSRLP